MMWFYCCSASAGSQRLRLVFLSAGAFRAAAVPLECRVQVSAFHAMGRRGGETEGGHEGQTKQKDRCGTGQERVERECHRRRKVAKGMEGGTDDGNVEKTCNCACPTSVWRIIKPY